MQEKRSQNAKNIIMRLLSAAKFSKDNELANALGIKTNTLSGWKTRGVSDYESIFALCEQRGINIDWVITGNGDMMASSTIVEEPHLIYRGLRNERINPKQMIPLYDVHAAAGLVTLFRDQSHTNPIDHLVIPNLPACDGAVYVTGDSMYPILKSGDIIAYKQVNDIRNNIFWGEMYLIAYQQAGDELVVVKYIKKSKRKDHVTLVSQNSHHAEKDIPYEAIKALAIVKASVRINSM